MKTERLSIIANQAKMATLSYRQGKLSLCYEPSWLASDAAFPLSVSMPLTESEFPHDIIDPYLWGLLPDNKTVLDQWGKQFQVSPRNVFRLLAHVGEDCAGAIQFIPEDRENELLEQPYREQILWLDEQDLNERIQLVLNNHGVQRVASDNGQFSLAGAQAKIALFQSSSDGAWGVPSGQTPTTHILKPAQAEFDGFAENEHFCLQLASALGMSVAESSVIHCANTPVIVVKRYDRFEYKGQCFRIHQEDFCQALSVPPQIKYQNEGGPAIADLAQTIWNVSSQPYEDIIRLADSIIFNYLIVGTDAHAKNFSLIFSGRDHVQLAPLYDIASALPYPHIYNPHKTRLAMKIGSSYQLNKIELRHWKKCASELKLPANELLGRLEKMCLSIQKLAISTARDLHDCGLNHGVIDSLSQKISQRAEDVQQQYFPD